MDHNRQVLFGIHSTNLCLLVGALNLFIFKVIISVYIPIAIFLIVLGLFLLVSVFHPFLFYTEFFAWRSSFSNYCNAGLAVVNSLSLHLSVKLLISPSNLNESLAG